MLRRERKCTVHCKHGSTRSVLHAARAIHLPAPLPIRACRMELGYRRPCRSYPSSQTLVTQAECTQHHNNERKSQKAEDVMFERPVSCKGYGMLDCRRHSAILFPAGLRYLSRLICTVHEGLVPGEKCLKQQYRNVPDFVSWPRKTNKVLQNIAVKSQRHYHLEHVSAPPRTIYFTRVHRPTSPAPHPHRVFQR